MPTDHGRLIWKLEDSAGESGVGDLEDLGPAWVELRSPNGSAVLEKLDDGEWMTRGRAREIARDRDLDLFEDDGRQGDDGPEASSGFDIDALNEAIAAMGITELQLRVREAPHDKVWLVGSLLAEIDENRGRGSARFGYRLGGRTYSIDDALSVLDKLVPGWR